MRRQRGHGDASMRPGANRRDHVRAVSDCLIGPVNSPGPPSASPSPNGPNIPMEIGTIRRLTAGALMGRPPCAWSRILEPAAAGCTSLDERFRRVDGVTAGYRMPFADPARTPRGTIHVGKRPAPSLCGSVRYKAVRSAAGLASTAYLQPARGLWAGPAGSSVCECARFAPRPRLTSTRRDRQSSAPADQSHRRAVADRHPPV